MQPLHTHRYGRSGARPVVLLHGVTDAGTAWPDLVSHWQERWDIHSPDLRGHGRSPRFAEDQLDAAPDVMLDDVLAVLEHIGEPVALIGHSLGGFLALRAALARPRYIAALVLEDPARPSGSTPDPQFVAANEALLDSMVDPGTQIERMLRETPWTRTEVEAWAACKPLVDRRYIARGLFLGEALWEERFEALSVPTLLILPPEAPMAPRPVRNDSVRTVVIPESGHCVRRDQPGRYHEAVDAFLADHLDA
ncbi:alpha/beta fold hydrolase [Pseudactinotalea sp. Z1732]|uniref:alpha/beta fold hydrolase n=1 Tax=Pseudactinotalea sp. Z1732 TaxID=3413026 RepID=UPI003C7D7162